MAIKKCIPNFLVRQLETVYSTNNNKIRNWLLISALVMRDNRDYTASGDGDWIPFHFNFSLSC